MYIVICKVKEKRHIQSTNCKCVCLQSEHNWQEAITLSVLKRSTAKKRTKPIFVSAGPASRLGCTTVWDITQEDAAFLHTTGHINVQMYARKFQKSQNYWAKWGSYTQIVGIMNNYHTFYGTFLNFLRNNDFNGFNWEKSKHGVKLLFSSDWR